MQLEEETPWAASVAFDSKIAWQGIILGQHFTVSCALRAASHFMPGSWVGVVLSSSQIKKPQRHRVTWPRLMAYKQQGLC